MPAAFDDEAQIVVPREIHRSRDVLGVSRGNRVRARLGGPRIHPTQGLREPGFVADEVRILQILEETLGGSASWIGLEGRQRKADRNQASADRIIQLFPCGR